MLASVPLRGHMPPRSRRAKAGARTGDTNTLEKPMMTNPAPHRTAVFRALAVCVTIVLTAGAATGATTYDLLRFEAAPRGAALGGHSLALSGGEFSSLASHPAGLAGLEQRQLSASYADHPLDVAGGRFAYGAPTRYGYTAASLTYLSYGSFDRRNSLEEDPSGTFTPSDLLVTAGFARSFGHGVGVGVAAKFIRGEIDTYTSSALVFDASAHWDTGFRMIELAAGFSNAGFQLEKYGETAEALPLLAHAGIAKQLEHLPLKLSLTGHADADGTLWGVLAGEFTVSPLLKLRAGYSSDASDYHVGGSQDTAAGLSAGIGLTHRGIRLDYAFHSQGALGNVHRLGVGYAF